jgi:hypothetical protein
MTFFTTKIRPFIKNSIFRYSHHHHYQEPYYLSQQERDIRSLLAPQNKIIINLLGDKKSVDTASWEIKGFASEKSLHTANIVYDNEMLNHFLFRKTILQFIVNRCYNMSCHQLFELNENIIDRAVNWKPYNLYVLPDATNRFITCDFIRNCDHSKIIIYPLAASEENKRRDINILID